VAVSVLIAARLILGCCCRDRMLAWAARPQSPLPYFERGLGAFRAAVLPFGEPYFVTATGRANRRAGWLGPWRHGCWSRAGA